jgi:MoxR-like ATPase
MQEKKVTVGGETYPIAAPFLVFATQNPIEQEGTYPLPEAELDRFMFEIDVSYPSYEEEVEIVKTTTGTYKPEPRKILDSKKILEYQDLVHRVPVSDHGATPCVWRATGPKTPHPGISEAGGIVGVGRQYLILGAGRAILAGSIPRLRTT